MSTPASNKTRSSSEILLLMAGLRRISARTRVGTGLVLAFAVFASSAAASTAHAVSPADKESRSGSIAVNAKWVPGAARASRGDQLAALHPTGPLAVLIGLREPGATRGVTDSTILIPREVAQAEGAELAHKFGFSIEYWDAELPTFAAILPKAEILPDILSADTVDYVDDNSESVDTPKGAGSGGQGSENFTEFVASDTDAMNLGGDPLQAGCSSDFIDPDTSTRDPGSGDILPWNFDPHGIQQAWLRGATGQGITVAAIDTGILVGNTQLQMPEFAGLVPGRTVHNYGFNSWPGAPINTPFGTCNHGNRIAGLIAAPRDGLSTEGVAWAANLETVYTHGSVIIGGGNAGYIAMGIRAARHNGARIFNLAFGNLPFAVWFDSGLNFLGDFLRLEYHRTDLPSVLFVGAAGTLICPTFNDILFPANLPEVIAVAAVNADGTTVPTDSSGLPDSCTGPAVDVAAIIGNGTQTTGPNNNAPERLGGSSGASAMISGMLALIWSVHPDWTAEQVRDQLYSSTRHSRGDRLGFGVPNVYRAVGGFTHLSIDGPETVSPEQTYTLSANTTGDGPFNYQWSTGATSRYITQTAAAAGTSQDTTVTVTDQTDGSHRTASARVAAADPAAPDDPDDDPCRRFGKRLPWC